LWFHFLRTIPLLRPRCIPMVVRDWVVGLSMRDYVQRHYGASLGEHRTAARRRLRRLERSLRRYVEKGALDVSLADATDVVANVTLSLHGWLDQRFCRRAGRHLRMLLKHTSATVTLRIRTLHEAQRDHLQHLLKSLARYGDRVSVAVPDDLRELVELDSSVFHLIMEYQWATD
jgi:hypothetical protein